MASSNSTPDKLPNGSKSPLSGIKQESVECLSCVKSFYREKTTKFTLIACPYCSCPHYQGALNNEQRVIFYESVTAFLKQKQRYDHFLDDLSDLFSDDLSDLFSDDSSPLLDDPSPLKMELVEDLCLEPTHQIVDQTSTKTSTPEKSGDISNQEINLAVEEKNLENSSLPRIISSRFIPPWLEGYNALPWRGRGKEVVEFVKINNVKEVAQGEQSLNQQWVGQKEDIYFEVNTNTGSYWLIRSRNQQMPVYHIVPNKRKFRFIKSALPAMQAHFEFKKTGTDGSQEFDPSKVDMNQFKVIYPAEVEEVVPGQKWQLKAKGLLEFYGLVKFVELNPLESVEPELVEPVESESVSNSDTAKSESEKLSSYSLSKNQKPISREGSLEEVVKCFHCHQQFKRHKRSEFSLISCPHCGGPNYQGDISNPARKLLFEQAVLTYQYQMGMNPPPGLDNPYYHSSVPVQPSPVREVSSTRRRFPVADSSSSPHSSPNPRCDENALKRNTTEDWAKWIESVVKNEISLATREIKQENQRLLEKIEQLQEQLQQDKPNEKIGETSNQANQELLTRLDRLEEQLDHQHRERQATHQQIYRYERQILDLSERLAKISQIQQKHEALLDKPVAVSDISKPEPNLIPVDMTEETVHNCLNNNRDVILFQNKGTGRYWVKPMQDGENDTKIYYLVCKKTVKFTLESLTLVQSCFEFENPDAPSSQVEITLPAIVSLSGSGNTWQLVKRGKLSFIHPLGES